MKNSHNHALPKLIQSVASEKFNSFTEKPRTFSIQRVDVSEITSSVFRVGANRRVYLINPNDHPVLAALIDHTITHSTENTVTTTSPNQQQNGFLVSIANDCTDCDTITCAVTEHDDSRAQSISLNAITTCPFTGTTTPPDDNITTGVTIVRTEGTEHTVSHDSQSKQNVFSPSTHSNNTGPDGSVITYAVPDNISTTLVTILDTLLDTRDIVPHNLKQPTTDPTSVHADVHSDRETFDIETSPGSRVEWVLQTLTEPRPLENIADAVNMSHEEIGVVALVYTAVGILHEPHPERYELTDNYTTWVDKNTGEDTEVSPFYSFVSNQDQQRVVDAITTIKQEIAT